MRLLSRLKDFFEANPGWESPQKPLLSGIPTVILAWGYPAFSIRPCAARVYAT